MKKLTIVTMILFYVLSVKSQVSISGPANTCVNVFNVYTSSHSLPSNWCKDATAGKFIITGSSGIVFDNLSSGLQSKTYNVSASTNSVNSSIAFTISGNHFIKTEYQCLNDQGGIINSAFNYYNVYVKPNWNGGIGGDLSPNNSGTYTYTVTPALGATSYAWTLPPGFQCISNCNSNTITVSVGNNAHTGSITVTSNSTTICSGDQVSSLITIDECFNKNRGEYAADRITNRVVSGDFDNDGREDDLAGLYDYGTFTPKMHVWKSNGSNFSFQGINGWWQPTSYDASRVVEMVSGDFDRDGFKDDIAMFYDYGGNHTRIHILTSNGSSFSSSTWYINYSYNAQKVKGRIVSGDFDRDGFKDDIAAFYDYGNFTTRIHVWTSTGTSFNGPSTMGWYSNNSYDANKVTDRVISGDFDRDGYVDDIAAFYDYGNFTTRIHVWTSTGSSFNGPSTMGWYSNSNYDANKITGRIVSGDFDKDGYMDDIISFYDYGSLTTRLHVWTSTGSSFLGPTTNGWWSSTTYNANKLTNRVVSGNFTNSTLQGNNDIVGFYDYENFNIAAHVWKSFNSYFSFMSVNGFWNICHPNENKNIEFEPNNTSSYTENSLDSIDYEITNNSEVVIFPNPTNNYFSIMNASGIHKIELINNIGQTVGIYSLSENNIYNLDTQISPGIYYLKLHQENNSFIRKLIIQK